MPSSTLKLLALTATLSAGAASRVHAQEAGAPAEPRCDGLRVSRLDIQPARPAFTGHASRWRTLARTIGLHHATTRDGVVDAFLALDVGQICTEVRRAESERVLRVQPFLADATVRAVPDGAGGVVLTVRTVDEIPVLINGRFRGIVPGALSLGNENIGGLGLLVEANVERGYAYQTGFGVRVLEYATFGRPYVAAVDAQRYTLGHRISTALDHPFYTDLQQVAWHVGYLSSHEYPPLRRPARDQLALGVHQERWEASSVARVFGTRTVGLVGAAATGLRVLPASQGVVVSDTGLAADTGTTLLNRYSPFKAVRVGLLGGLRRVSFRTVRGFDGLTAQQDVANGVFTGLYVAKGLPSLGVSDLFLSGIAYAGAGGAKVYLASLAQVEGRRAAGLGRWDSVIGSGRGALYIGRGPGWVFVTDDQFSGGTRSLLPLQLALGDRQGGILGYHESALAGAYRNVARAELRWAGAALVRGADMGFATFSQVGSVLAGDAPYGRTATRANVGISVLAAYPTGSKRMYRADLGIPLRQRGEGGAGIEIRFSSEDRTQLFWREPSDVSRARTGTIPTSLFAFPAR
jgi:hypothetical protein